MSIKMIELAIGKCRWPLENSDEGELLFCGAPSDPSLSYCEKHMVKAHAPVRKKPN
jgi:hypothetical protein